MLKLTLVDGLLIPLYAVILNYIFGVINKQSNTDPLHRKYFLSGFRLKLLFGVLFAMFSIFLVSGDTEMYYTGGLDFKTIIFDDSRNLRFLTSSAKEFSDFYEMNGFRSENYGYVSNPGNLMAMKFVALFSVISFDSYTVIGMLFSSFSFAGLWYSAKVFFKMQPGISRIIFLIFFCIPSVLFWGSGVSKDSLCIGFLGLGFYNAHLLFFEKKYQAKILVVMLTSFYCLFTLKSYIAMAFIPSFLIWFLLYKIQQEQSKLRKLLWAGLPITILVGFVIFGNLSELIAEKSVSAMAENVISTQKGYIRATADDGALIDYGEITPTLQGILKIVPKALVATLFRPFVWEARKITSFMAALEGAFLIYLTVYVFFKRGIFKTLGSIISDSTISFTFFFSIVFAIAIGLNCFNLGTLVRYKIPCLPFYLLSLVLILKKTNEKTIALA